MNHRDLGKTQIMWHQSKQRKALLLDDSETDREMYRRYLKSDGEYQYTFIESESAENALAINGSVWLDVVLLDYQLPEMNGIDWLQQWQQLYDELDRPPVIALTGQGDEEIAVQFIKLGAADYIVKDRLTPERLRLAVNQAIAFQQLQREKADLVERSILLDRKLTRSNRLRQMESIQKRNLQQILQNLPMVVYAKEVDPETKRSGKLWLVNREWQRVFALSDAEAIGKTDSEIFPDEIARAFASNDRLVIDSKQSLTAEERVYHRDGRLRDYLSFKFPVFDDGGRVVSIVGIAKDITEDKQIRSALQVSESRFVSTFEQAAVGIAHVSPDGKWLRVNQKLCEIVGYSKQELLQKTFQEITHPEDLEGDLAYFEQMLAGEIETYSMEKRYLHQNGETVWINLTVSSVKDSQGKPDYFISVIEDISDRRKLKHDLERSLWRLSNLHYVDRAILEEKKPQAMAQTAIERIQDFFSCQRISIVTFDYEEKTATVLATKDKVRQLIDTHYQVPLSIWQGLINRLESTSDEYQVAYLSNFPQLADAVPTLKQARLECFVAFPLRVGKNLLGILKVWVEDLWMVATGELDIIGEVSNSIAIALEQSRLNRQAQNYTHQLEAKVAQRTRELKEINGELKAFTYTISHDLKAPLRAIQGFATALEEDYGDRLDDLGTEYTHRLVSSAHHMDLLIQDLLTYSRLSRSEIELRSVDLSYVTARAIEELKLEIEKAGATVTTVEPLGQMLGNRTILIQIVSNLISNAIKFVASEQTPQVRIWSEINGDTVRLWVEDNGIGIKPEHQKRIFRVFERLHGNEVYKGTGIGLAIVKKGIERLSGKAGVESNLDRGSRFWIEGAIAR